LALSNAGIVSGAPTGAGFFSTLIQATDTVGSAIRATLSFSITGGHIAGTVTAAGDGPLNGVSVQIYNSAGAFVTSSTTDASGNYTTAAVLPTGTYYARTSNSLGYIDELYNDITCFGCHATTGTPIPVTAGSTTSNINFGLVAGGRVSGRVTAAATGAALSGVSVRVYQSGANPLTFVFTDASG